MTERNEQINGTDKTTESFSNSIFNNATLFDQFLFADPDYVIDHLNENKSFPSRFELVRNCMHIKFICNEDACMDQVITILTDLLNKQDATIDRERKNLRKIVKRWIDPEDGRYCNFSRQSAIEICFALKLRLNLANDFLNKAAIPCFNVRDAEDAIYMYSLEKEHSLKEALDLIERYNELPDTPQPAAVNRNAHSGETTLIMMENLLKGVSCTNDDEFFETYLIPNKPKFIGYASTARREYYKIKNSLYIYVLQNTIDQEILTDHNNELYTSDTLSRRVRNTVRDYYDLFDLEGLDLEKPENIVQILKIIKRKADRSDDLDTLEKISNFFSKVISIEGLITTALPAYEAQNYNFRNNADFNLPRDLMTQFPSSAVFRDFEKDPITIQKNIGVRKAIILMFYLKYVYTWTYDWLLSLNQKQEDQFEYNEHEEKGFSAAHFYRTLNQTLKYCQLGTLIPEYNRFDWLILMSIKSYEYELIVEDDELYDKFIAELPSYFFNVILENALFDRNDEDDEMI